MLPLRHKLGVLLVFPLIIVGLLYPVSAIASAPHAAYSSGSSGFERLVVYYGWLNTSNLVDLNVDIVVVPGSERILPSGDDNSVVSTLRGRGVLVFAYLEDLNGAAGGAGSDSDTSDDQPIGLGSSFKKMVVDNTTGSIDERYSYWLGYLESSVDNYAGVVDGVFLDECDPAYFTSDLSSRYVDYFTQGISDLTGYAHSKGLLVFINGVMGYAGYGDYYLWEDFLDSYSNGYVLLDDFLVNQSYSSDLEWVNGLSRYYYLKEHGLLDKTIAVTFVDPNHPETEEWGRAAYFLARIMGLAGWGYSNYTYYSSGGSVPVGLAGAYETGIPVGPPVFTGGHAWRFFLDCGNASVSVGDSGVSVGLDPGYTFPTVRVVVDGENNGEYSNVLQGDVSGSSSVMRFTGVVNSQSNIYFLVNWSYNTQASPGGLLHVYLDTDGNAGTGYSVDGVGADYLVEVSTDGNGILYSYGGSGWSWSSVGYVNTVVVNNGLSYQAEFSIDKTKLNGLDESYAKYVVRTVYNWSDDADSGAQSLPGLELLYPTYYEPAGGLDSYTGVVVSTQLSQGRMVLISEGPAGAIVNYTVVAPFSTVDSVLVNGTVLQEGLDNGGTGWTVKKTWNGYSEVMVLAEHHSPINITITGSGEPLPVSESYYSSLSILAALAAVLLYWRRSGSGVDRRVS